MHKTLQRGFTLIELLVVIAIIGILAAVVLASLNDARDSGQDASIKQSIGNARSQAELSYNSNGYSYANVCDTATTNPVATLAIAAANNRAEITTKAHLRDSAYTAERVICNDTAVGYVMLAPLNVTTAGTHWCVDSTGFAGPVTSTAISAATDITCN